ncbi:cell wall-binding repeat-containing protein [Desulfosporosinus metallidurans]|uniref:N-acetylmuramoyl-L-alanine amidase n=1 Tax=Desulfosporosinus metallidurans TaxID=1888891 RepID=A0A1Q8R0D2_9FIRM|nr:cell wall-binding repeat-containing protein [Desulfosporosinus metallidurans]OLN33011.1 N-acetylmuramoyl-L-alanine amidase [Desulfosporosinus metallidurans]
MKKKLISIFLTTLFTFSYVPPTLATTSSTTISPIINRISGQNRYDTSSAIAKQGWPNGSSNCILTYGGNYSDSLAATPLAKKYDAPILLTESASLTPITRQVLIDLKTKNVTIIGGTGVISSSVDTELQSMGITANRVFGNDKYETAIAVAKQVTSTPSIIFVCTSDDFSDALSISPIASIKRDPIILVPNNNIPDSVKDYISSNKSIVKSYVIGNSDEITDNVVNQFPNYERISGNDRYSRNIAVNKEFESVFNLYNTIVTSGEQFPDALSGSALASKISAPIILVNDASPNDTKSYYKQRLVNASNSGSSSSNYNPSVYVFGGTAVVPDSVIQELGQGQVITVSHLSAVNVTTTAGTAPVLPSTVTATMSDGTSKMVNVNWAGRALSQPTSAGNYIVIGTIAESTIINVIATVTVADVNPVAILTIQQVQQEILGTWKTSDGKHTLEFHDDGTLEETEVLTGYTNIYKEKYSFSNPTRIRIVNSSWAEDDNFVLNGNRLEISNLGISRIRGNSNNFSNTDSFIHPSFSQSSISSNYVFTKVN